MQSNVAVTDTRAVQYGPLTKMQIAEGIARNTDPRAAGLMTRYLFPEMWRPPANVEALGGPNWWRPPANVEALGRLNCTAEQLPVQNMKGDGHRLAGSPANHDPDGHRLAGQCGGDIPGGRPPPCTSDEYVVGPDERNICVWHGPMVTTDEWTGKRPPDGYAGPRPISRLSAHDENLEIKYDSLL